MIITGKKSASRTVYGATGTATEKTAITDTNFKSFIDTDPVLNSNLRQLQDGVFEKYPRLDCAENEAENDKRNKDLNRVGFGQKVKDSFAGIWHNGNMFFEIDMVGTKLNGFYMIDSDTMKVVEDDYGNVKEYIQSQPSGDKTINADRIIHIKAPSLKTGTLGEPLLLPLDSTLHRKVKAENYLAGMLDNLNPLIWMNLDGYDDTQGQDLQNALRVKRDPTDPTRILYLNPDEKIQRLDTGTTSNFEAVQKYIDSQNSEITRILQIPPIVAGTVDDSNRSNSEIQERAVFGRTTMAWQNFLNTELDREFEQKAKWKSPKFEFPIEDKRKRESALVEATKLKDLSYSNEAIHEYLVAQGVKVMKDFVEEPEEGINEDLSGFESRQPRDKGGIPQNEEQRLKDQKNGTEKKSQ